MQTLKDIPAWAKAWGGAIIAGLLALIPTLGDSQLARILGIVVVVLGTGIGVYQIPNHRSGSVESTPTIPQVTTPPA